MTIAHRLKRHLDNQGITYDVVAHPHTTNSSFTAQAAHIPGNRVVKTVVVHHEMGYALAVVPSTHRIELGSLQSVMDKRLGLATEREIASIFSDCEVGAVPPIGAAYGLPVLLDECLADEPDLYFEGGDHRSLVHVSDAAFRALTKGAQSARFSHHA
jgi:Ala-tRNA(Pro) deacylase